MDSNSKNGGPAFPQCVGVGTEGNVIASYDFVDGAGMSLRDYFAAKAMQGALAGVPGPHLTPNRCAEEAYAMADAMLKARG